VTSLCFIDKFPDESVLQRISSRTRLCSTSNQNAESLCFADPFADESVLRRSVP